MFTDSNLEVNPDFTSFAFSWEDKQATTTAAGTPKSETPNSRSQKVLKTSRRRIVRACMRCRLRKTKCDGGKPCTRCTEADDICEYMKCSKKESKEYSQDYVDRLLEQNDKYKTAMRILYANRRLSIQPDNIIIPSIESEDVPLVHDILDRLGMVWKDSDEMSQSSGSHFEKPSLSKAPTFGSDSTMSVPSPTNSNFNSTYFDDSLFSLEAPLDETFSDTNTLSFDPMSGLSVPFEAFSTMNSDKNISNFMQFTSDFPQSTNMSTQDWTALESMMNVDFPVDQTWNAAFQPSSY